VKRFQVARVVTRIVGDDFCVAWETNRYSVSPTLAGHTVKVRVLEGRLEVEVAGNVVAAHRLREARHQRVIAPEHEAEFRRTSTSRLVLGDQFRQLGAVAEQFADGLMEARGGAAGYHMGQILRLAERVGVPRVLDALRHAVRSGAFDHNAVARIVGAKPSSRRAPHVDAAAATIQHVDKYLQGAGTHQRPPDGYARLAKPLRPMTEPDDGE
jgi:hypothetical protein